MTELEKIKYTKSFIDKLANGVNPLSGEAIPENDLLNNVRISRCMFYVSGILDNICNQLNNNISSKRIRNAEKRLFFLSDEQMQKFNYEEFGCYVGNIIDRLNVLIDQDAMQKIKRKKIVDWLIIEGYLYFCEAQNGRQCLRPTSKGMELGIKEETRLNANGEYWVLIYSKSAQKFIVENINIIVKSQYSVKKAEKQARRWAIEQVDV